MFEIRHYITDDGRDVFADWRDKVKDSKAKIAIDRRIYRAEPGNFGDHKPCREGVGASYRHRAGLPRLLRAGRVNRGLVALRRHQAFAGADISKACEYWKGWQRSNVKQEKER